MHEQEGTIQWTSHFAAAIAESYLVAHASLTKLTRSRVLLLVAFVRMSVCPWKNWKTTEQKYA